MKNIIVPTDFSEIAQNATRFAMSVAKHIHGKLVFFHADEDLNSSDLLALRKETAKIQALVPDVTSTFVASNKRFNSLTLKETFKDKVDFIVIGTSGESADISKKLFGTNTSEILEDVNCPVMAIPEGCTYQEIKRIAYASDLIKLEKELEKIISLAKQFGASIEVFHVSPIFPDLGDVEKMNIPAKIEQLKQKYTYDLINYSIQKTTRDNQIQSGIHSFLSQHNSDLLVIFHNNVSGIDRFLTDSETEKLVTHVKTPLLVFPKI